MSGPRLRPRTPLRAALAGVAAAAVLTACSGGSGAPSASGPPSSPTPSSTTTASTTTTTGASGSAFCTQAQTFADDAGRAVAAGTGSPDIGRQLQTLATQLQSITPPPEIASDWQSATATLQQFAQAYQGVDLSDPQQVQQLQQKIAPLIQQLTTSGTRIEQYLQTRCGISTGGTSESAATSS